MNVIPRRFDDNPTTAGAVTEQTIAVELPINRGDVCCLAVRQVTRQEGVIPEINRMRCALSREEALRLCAALLAHAVPNVGR